MLNILSLMSFANAVFFIFIAGYSIVSGPKSTINQASALECFLLAVWSFSYTFFYVAPSKEAAWFWLRMGSIGWSSFMGALLWFFLALTRNNKKPYHKLKMAIVLAFTILLNILNLCFKQTSAAVDLVQSTSGLGWTYVNHVGNPLYWLYITDIIIGCTICAIILARWLKASKSKHFKKLAISFLVVDGFLIIIGFISDLIIPLVTDILPPMTNVFLVIFCFSYWIIIFELDVFKKTSLESSEFIMDTISDALMVLDKDGKILHCNKATEELLKYKVSEIIGTPLIKYYKNSNFDPVKLDQLRGDKKLTNIETDLIAKDKSIIHSIYSASMVENDIHGFMGFIISFHDITKQKNLELKLFDLAHFDALTGLPNRRYFFDFLYEYEKLYYNKNYDFAVLFMDLNGFKEINDTMGHDKGDLLLVEVGNRIKNCTSGSDMVARIGGDEFVMLQTEVTDRQQVEDRKNLILKALEPKVLLDDKECFIGAAIGFALYSEKESISHLMNMADSRMYSQKERKHVR